MGYTLLDGGCSSFTSFDRLHKRMSQGADKSATPVA
jgi:hypothetical protein